MTIRTVLFVRNSAGSGPGRLPGWLAEEGLRTHVVEGDRIPAAPGAYGGIVLLGGGFLPDADDDHPWLAAERELARACVAGGVPLLGVCLGAQLLAAALGGTVTGDHGEPERGACEVTLLPEAAGDPLFGALPGRFPVLQNHRDQITGLPAGAVRLAESPACPVQAFRAGARAWGVQFHPEAGTDRLAHWDEAALAGAGVDPAGLRAAAEPHERRLTAAARSLTAAFAAQVRVH
ncbi:type 1 glutamine amidotransferase [Actinoplanes sp. G11-F43]|uniref:type 1 glutamine amidotransferase n=1 Tax=Actinoplanes sp. G11-F43 TaxID=3424130 RepID=UPI003D34224D